MEKNIELELRAEITLGRFDRLIAVLKRRGKLVSRTKRLSVMFWGKINRAEFDIRVRIGSDSDAELVAKRGDHHSYNRVETSQKILKNQFIGIVKILTLLGLKSKVTERENFVFDLGNKIKMSLVKAKSIAYVEIEKMSHIGNVEENKEELLKIADDFNLRVINNAEEFNELCDRLTKFSDWNFDGSPTHVRKLAEMLKSY
ncbi:hypothetical protein A2127_00990 [Candidatus Jorgensenbacteria bacterium GWC1_48_12]|uniref:CYTH domain-containing protein n=1 Tax=Candidatus Jorgensenbacteria bacterium GWC1_48_12 TaxID=1798469 RepID=A0A1F6BSM0_9BACT|nr:MAG: hypothetical protein A2127_00990 [Candidatus Jorgensenbacteria bacterium GWC1_48_12]